MQNTLYMCSAPRTIIANGGLRGNRLAVHWDSVWDSPLMAQVLSVAYVDEAEAEAETEYEAQFVPGKTSVGQKSRNWCVTSTKPRPSLQSYSFNPFVIIFILYRVYPWEKLTFICNFPCFLLLLLLFLPFAIYHVNWKLWCVAKVMLELFGNFKCG